MPICPGRFKRLRRFAKTCGRLKKPVRRKRRISEPDLKRIRTDLPPGQRESPGMIAPETVHRERYPKGITRASPLPHPTRVYPIFQALFLTGQIQLQQALQNFRIVHLRRVVVPAIGRRDLGAAFQRSVFRT
jgi:hypothetical protein